METVNNWFATRYLTGLELLALQNLLMLANTSQHQFLGLEDLTNNVAISAMLYHYKFVCTIYILIYSHDKVDWIVYPDD